MHEETVTYLNPPSLTDKELVKYAERLFYKDGLPKEFQLELIRRFDRKVNN
jgi:hypothetical protein